MNSLTEVMPRVSTTRRGPLLNRVFVMAYLAAIAVATIGWVSAFGWLTVRVAKWIFA
jgi:hypothetical protein